MVNASYTVHKSVLLAVREALVIYLLEKNREQDISKIKAHLPSLDNYQGERVPLPLVIQEVHTISSMVHDDSLGIKLNMLVDIKKLQFYNLIKESIKTLHGNHKKLPFLIFIRMISNFFSLVTESLELKVIESNENIHLRVSHNESAKVSKNQVDGLLILIYRIINVFYPDMLEALYLEGDQLSYESYEYISALNVSVSGSNATTLVYSLEHKDYYKNLSFGLLISEVEIERNFFISPLFNAMTQQFEKTSYKKRCKMIINIIIGVVPPTRQYVAGSMNISVSTLQRRLKDEESTFQEILDEARKNLVLTYLNESNLSTTNIAYLLGYKSHSQFFKAFKSWFATTPKALLR